MPRQNESQVAGGILGEIVREAGYEERLAALIGWLDSTVGEGKSGGVTPGTLMFLGAQYGPDAVQTLLSQKRLMI